AASSQETGLGRSRDDPSREGSGVMRVRDARGRSACQSAFPPGETRFFAFVPRALVVLLFCGTLAHCGDAEVHASAMAVRGADRSAATRAPVRRIVSLIPSVNDILLELGAG